MNPNIFLKLKGYYLAFFSALLFGMSMPISKYLLNEINPWLLAGLLYLSSGSGLTAILVWRRLLSEKIIEFGFKNNDWKWLAGSTIFGGIIGPVLLLFGLTKTNAATASLLLSSESVFSIVIAWILFREKINEGTAIWILLIISGSVVLTWTNQLKFNSLLGPFLVIAACLSWSIDNNMLKKISATDPVAITLIKSLVAGFTNTTLGLMVGGVIPSKLNVLIESSLVGLICYGFSMVLFVLALRYIGVARTSAYYSFYPLIGACFSVIFFDDIISTQLITSIALMSCGVLLHIFRILREKE